MNFMLLLFGMLRHSTAILTEIGGIPASDT